MCLTIIIDCISIHKLFMHIYNKRNMDLFQVLNLIDIIISELLNIRNSCDVEFHMYFEELIEMPEKMDFENNISTQNPEKYFKISVSFQFF